MSEESKTKRWRNFRDLVSTYHSLAEIPNAQQTQAQAVNFSDTREEIIETGTAEIEANITAPLKKYFQELKDSDPSHVNGFFSKHKARIEKVKWEPLDGDLCDPTYLLDESGRLDALAAQVYTIFYEVEPAIKSLRTKLDLVQRQVRACLPMSKEQAATALSTLFIPRDIYEFLYAGELVTEKCEMFFLLIKSRRQTINNAVSLYPYTQNTYDRDTSRISENPAEKIKMPPRR